jgi:hypothetical protein
MPWDRDVLQIQKEDGGEKCALWNVIIFVLNLDEIRNGDRGRTCSAHGRSAFGIMVWKPEEKKEYWSDKTRKENALLTDAYCILTFSEQGNTEIGQVLLSGDNVLWSLLNRETLFFKNNIIWAQSSSSLTFRRNVMLPSSGLEWARIAGHILWLSVFQRPVALFLS